jgi:hypothetical protein
MPSTITQKAPSGATASLRCEPRPDRAQGASGPAGFARVRYSDEGSATDANSAGRGARRNSAPVAGEAIARSHSGASTR